MTSRETAEYNSKMQRMSELKAELKSLEEEKKNIARYLKTKGEGEIAITKKVYPNCSITIKNIQTEIKEPCLATTFLQPTAKLNVFNLYALKFNM